MKRIEASHHNATLIVDAPQDRHEEVARRLVAALVEAGVADGLPYIGPMEEPATGRWSDANELAQALDSEHGIVARSHAAWSWVDGDSIRTSNWMEVERRSEGDKLVWLLLGARQATEEYLSQTHYFDAVSAFYLSLRSILSYPIRIERRAQDFYGAAPYLRPRPPFELDRWMPGAVMIVDRVHVSSPDGDTFGQRRYLEAQLPWWVERQERNGVVVDRWLPNLADTPENRVRLSDQESWLGAVLGLGHEAGWNTAGDILVDSTDLVDACPELTLYHPPSARGFQAVVPDGDRIGESHLSRAMELKRKGQLADGRPLNRVDVIFPSRESAVKMRPTAKAQGAARTLYIDDHGQLWNVYLSPRHFQFRSRPPAHILATATHGLPDSLAAKVEAIIVEGAKGGPLPHVESLEHELEGRVTAAMEVIEAHRSSDKWGTACSSD